MGTHEDSSALAAPAWTAFDPGVVWSLPEQAREWWPRDFLPIAQSRPRSVPPDEGTAALGSAPLDQPGETAAAHRCAAVLAAAVQPAVVEWVTAAAALFAISHLHLRAAVTVDGQKVAVRAAVHDLSAAVLVRYEGCGDLDRPLFGSIVPAARLAHLMGDLVPQGTARTASGIAIPLGPPHTVGRYSAAPFLLHDCPDCPHDRPAARPQTQGTASGAAGDRFTQALRREVRHQLLRAQVWACRG